MKTLIVGGCGFIGSHVADRLHKEGHKIYILDNLSTGNSKNVTVPHKLYNLSSESKDCEEIFKSNKFDVVIDLSSQVYTKASSKTTPIESISPLPGITNLLELSQKYGVHRFIFASSAAVYGNNINFPLTEDSELDPLSPYAVSKYVSEFYCKKWSDLYGLKTICLRFSNVFGPRQRVDGESSVIPSFLTKSIKNSEINVLGDGYQTRDFIYVEDVVDAIYKSLTTNYTGVLNISTNTKHSLNELIYILKEFQSIRKVNYKESRIGDIKTSILDNSKAKAVLGWDTKYSLKTGMEKTYNWYKKNYKPAESQNIKEDKEHKKSNIFKYVPYLENLLFALIIALLTFRVLKIHDAFSTSFTDFCYIYIIVIAIMYGMKQASISIIFSCIMYFYLLLSSGYNIVTILYDSVNLLHILSYIIIGLVCGYAVDVHKRKIYLNNLEINTINNKYKFLDSIYNETISAKEKLEEQVISSQNSFANIYNTTKTLDTLEVNDIYFGSVKIIDKLLNTTKSSIYILSNDDNYLRLKAKSAANNFSLPYSVNVDQFKEIENVINTRTIFVNKTLNPKLPTMMAPVVINGYTKAIISIYDLKFEKLTLYYENLFKVLVDLISNAIGKALKYDELTSKSKYITNTEILINEEFKKVLADKVRNQKTSGINFTLLKIENNDFTYEDNFNKLSILIRDDDLVGIGDDNSIYIILSNTDKPKSKKVLDRIFSSGLNAVVMEDLY